MSEEETRALGDRVLPFKGIARRIGIRLRDHYAPPESEPLPAEHVDLLLRLRHKERERIRRSA